VEKVGRNFVGDGRNFVGDEASSTPVDPLWILQNRNRKKG